MTKIIGGLAKQCAVLRQTVQLWISVGRVPVRQVFRVSKVSGILVEQLNPDILNLSPVK